MADRGEREHKQPANKPVTQSLSPRRRFPLTWTQNRKAVFARVNDALQQLTTIPGGSVGACEMLVYSCPDPGCHRAV